MQRQNNSFSPDVYLAESSDIADYSFSTERLLIDKVGSVGEEQVMSHNK
ncbi:hypothetical protein [Nostoc sp. UHCC 0251]|nr:hypothetical protein [Nostoc sp. UHCC 0251]MEA5624286.1 hypothetical protein [Nostoc sp. UHCC 0251]